MQNYLELLKQASEDDLVTAAQRGSEPAFTELMRRHRSSSYKLALSILHDPQQAEDEVQNAYWKAFQHMRQFQHDAKFSTWMTRIVVNQCLMQLRQARRARFLFLDDALIGEERATMDLVDRAKSPEAQLGSKELAELISREIRRIPPLLRSVFVLRDVNQLPMDEVAGRLGISIPAAKSRLLRAREELKNRMQKHCGRRGEASLTA